MNFNKMSDQCIFTKSVDFFDEHFDLVADSVQNIYHHHRVTKVINFNEPQYHAVAYFSSKSVYSATNCDCN